MHSSRIDTLNYSTDHLEKNKSLSRFIFTTDGGKQDLSYFVLGDFLFSSSYDRTARCWDFHTGACIRIFRGHNHGILPLLFIPSNQDVDEENTFEEEMNIYTKDILITGSQDLTAKTWSFKTGECLKTFEGHIGAVLCLTTDIKGKILFTGSGDHTIRVWDIYRGNEIRIYDQHQAPIINLLVTIYKNPFI